MKKALSFAVVLGILLSTASVGFSQKSNRGVPLVGDLSRRKPSDSKAEPKAEGTIFQNIGAITSGSGVLVRWQMKLETANMGFHVYRNFAGTREIVNSDLIFGSAANSGRFPVYGEEYAFFDRSGGLGAVYEIEAIDLDGKKVLSSAVQTSYGKIPNVNSQNIPGMEDRNSSSKSGRISSSDLRIPKEVLEEFDAPAVADNPSVHQWVLSRPGVRIDVKTEGIYRVPFAQLQAAGFNTSSNNANWQLYLRGVEQAITVDMGAQYIEFYGKGIDTVETDIQGYFLVTGDTPGKRILPYVARPSNNSAVLTGYGQTFTFKERTIYLSSILNGEAENYFGRSIPDTGATINFDLTGIDFSSPTTNIHLKIQGLSSGIHVVQATLNGEVVASFFGIAQFPFETTKSISTSLLKDAALGQGQNALNLTSVGGGGDFNLFDTMDISFQRKPLAQQNTLKTYTLNSRKSLLRGFASANVRVFDITDPTTARIITNLPFQAVDGAFGVDFPAARPKAIFAVEDSGILSPQAVVAHDAELLSSTSQNAKLIIIAYRDFISEANAWAAYRTSQGIATKIVSVDEIFNEFNYGSLSSESIKSFLDYAYHNWQGSPQYVLLIGDASYDSRVYQTCSVCGFFNYVPTKIVTTVFTETGSDEYLSDFDNDGLAEMSIGRIPARHGSEVTTALTKVINWEANLNNPLNRGALFAYDTPDGYDFQGMSERLRDELPPGTPSTMVFRGQANAQADLLTAMNTGKYIVNYSGHGALGTWNNTNFFWNDNVGLLTNMNSESIYTALTCLNGYFLSLGGESLAEVLLKANNGGAVAVWASTGKTTPDVQEVMATRFYNRIGQGNIPRMGDLISDAKTAINGGTDVRLSWALIGDPMLKVR